jgi:DNA-binding NarL/FixJ family response regulator
LDRGRQSPQELAFECLFRFNSHRLMLRPASNNAEQARHPSLILLVDDEEMVVRLLSMMLERAGHTVLVASSAAEGQSLLSQFRNEIQLLVTDINLPGMSGLELAATATDACPRCPVLLISGRAMPEDFSHNGLWAFLPKPFGPAEFLEKVEAMLPSDCPGRPEPAGQPSNRQPGTRVRVIVVDDDAAMRESLARVIDSEYDIVGSFATGGSVINGFRDLNPDLVLLDISMPDLSGFSVARRLRLSSPDLPILFVTQHASRAYLEEAVESGVLGYVLKDQIVTELNEAMRKVHSGDSYVSPSLRR